MTFGRGEAPSSRLRPHRLRRPGRPRREQKPGEGSTRQCGPTGGFGMVLEVQAELDQEAVYQDRDDDSHGAPDSAPGTPVWVAIAASYETNYPVGLFVGTGSAVSYTLGRDWSAWRAHREAIAHSTRPEPD